MKKLRFSAINLFLTLFIISALVLVSCRKDHNYQGEIKVTDTLSNPVEGATVKISGDNSTPPSGYTYKEDVKQEGVTDSKGTYKFSLKDDNKGAAILKVKVTRDSLKGNGTIKLEENKLGKTTIIIKK